MFTGVICSVSCIVAILFFFFNDAATTEIYTLSLHDALPIFRVMESADEPLLRADERQVRDLHAHAAGRSEEHTSELQSQSNLVCRLLLEKKKKNFKQLSNFRDRIHLVLLINDSSLYTPAYVT